jgi:CRP-like cAMP-binding protein
VVTVAKLDEESRLEDELEELQTVLQPLRLPAGVSVFEQGETGDRLVWISDGEVRSSVRLPDGTDRLLSHAGPGDVVGEVALLTGSRRTASVTTLTPLRGWTLDRHGFEVLRWDPRQAAVAVVRRLLDLTTARLRACCTEPATLFETGDIRPRPPIARLPDDAEMPSTHYLASLLCFERFPADDDVRATTRGAGAYAVGRGAVLVDEGTRPPALWLVARGAIEVMVRSRTATRRLRLAGPGRFVGHGGALDDGASPVAARCRERSVVLAYPREVVMDMVGDNRRSSRAFSAALLEDTARAVRAASRPILPTKPHM